MTDTLTAYRTCPLCEATCGLEITVEAGEVTGIRGDPDDVFSHGFICPKGYAVKSLHEDPDRITTPLIRTGSGFEPATWDEAFEEIDRRSHRSSSRMDATRFPPTSATRTPTTSKRCSTDASC